MFTITTAIGVLQFANKKEARTTADTLAQQLGGAVVVRRNNRLVYIALVQLELF